MADWAWLQEEKRDPVPAAGRFGMTATTFGKELPEKIWKKIRRQKLWSEEEDVPEDVYAGVDQGRGEDGVGFAPGPTVEETGDGGEKDVAPVGKM